MNEIESGFVVKVTCPHCGAIINGNVPVKPANAPIYEYSGCTNCNSKFRIKRFTSGSWMVDSW